MKRMMFIAAAFAALVSCSKSETSQNPPTEPGTEDTPAAVEYAFTEGETVTITAGASLTKVSSALNDKNGVDFKWESDDTIKVMVDGNSSVFKVSKLKDDGANAEFTGKMPASGNDFDVQYPVIDPDLTLQTYSSTEAIPHDAMKFTAENCTVDKPFTLEAVNAAIRLNLYGTDQTVGKIVVTNTTSTADPIPSYTLIADPAITIGTTRNDSTSFFIVVEPGSWNFKAEIFNGASASICSFETSGPKTFTANQILNMSAKVVSVLLPGEFTVSAGEDDEPGTNDDKKVQFTKGNLYWDGSNWHLESSQTAYPTSWDTNYVGHFYWSKTASVAYAQDYSDESASKKDPFFCGEANAMTVDGQENLYALTRDEWIYLTSDRTNASNLRKCGVTVSNGGTEYTNCLIIAPDDFNGTLASSYTLEDVNNSGLVCLPAAGFRDGLNLIGNDGLGYYWSSTPSEGGNHSAYSQSFVDGIVDRVTYDRELGCSVRLVCSVSK